MKKIYIAPTMICVKMKTSKILMGSLTGDGVNMRINNSTFDSGSANADARGFDLDEDDF